jgi:hypothetical protein
MPVGKKGFMMSAPMIGAAIFMLAAAVALTMVGENSARISNARSAEASQRLQFVAAAIMADSYDVLLQINLERMTRNFMRSESDIRIDEDWTGGFRSAVTTYYIENLGEALGLDIEAYAKAYRTMPDVKDCVVEMAYGAQSDPSIRDSDRGDGTILARGYSYGERITCIGQGGDANITVDIAGREYRINMRVPILYNAARRVAQTARLAIDRGNMDFGILEPIASWESPSWHIIKKQDNAIEDPEEGNMEALLSDWRNKVSGFSGSFLRFANDYIRDSEKGLNYLGISLSDFRVEGESEEDRLENFEISCVEDGIGEYRNCMPYNIQIVLGKAACNIGEPPEGADNPYYSLDLFAARCGVGSCPQKIREILTYIIGDVGSVCVEYYSRIDSVYPVCRKWDAKARSVVVRGTVKDDHRDYVIPGEDEVAFMFRDRHTNVDVSSVRDNKLRCESGDGDEERYKSNVRKLLENLHIKIGLGSEVGASFTKWADKGSFIAPLQEEELTEIYRSIYAQGVLPIPCFTDGAIPDGKCISSEWRDRPRIEISIDWTEARTRCLGRVDEMCRELCGGSSLEQYRESFCRNLFPEIPTVGGKGELRCDYGNTRVEIDMISISRGGA